jgi:hypothetical protein
MSLTLLTKKFASCTFRLDLTADGSAYFVCKPIVGSKQNEIAKKVMAEYAFDAQIAAFKILPALLEAHIVGWEGLQDVSGAPIPYSKEMLLELCEYDYEFMEAQLNRIRRIAREGRLEEEKN